jgi:hypothetical protein
VAARSSSYKKALDARERRGTLLHVLNQASFWLDVSALRRFVDAKRQVVEQDLDRMAADGHIEVAHVKIYNPELDALQLRYMARKVTKEKKR